jgi:hypothetical protein
MPEAVVLVDGVHLLTQLVLVAQVAVVMEAEQLV